MRFAHDFTSKNTLCSESFWVSRDLNQNCGGADRIWTGDLYPERRISIPTGFSSLQKLFIPLMVRKPVNHILEPLTVRHSSCQLSSCLARLRPHRKKISTLRIYRFLRLKRKLNEVKNSWKWWVAGQRAWDPPDPVPNSEVKRGSVSSFSMMRKLTRTWESWQLHWL